jgi:hypothetical protein
MIRGPIERNIVYFSLTSRSLFYNNSPPYLFSPLLANYTYIVRLTLNMVPIFL